MNLESKIDETLRFLKTELAKYQHPVLAWSGGKDSMCLLHLMYFNEMHLPVVYYRDPFFPRKNRFVNFVIDSYLLECHDYPPLRVSLKHSPQMIALVSEYSTGPASVLAVLKNSLEFQDGDNEKDFLCGLNFLMRPCGTFNFPWDAMLVAHRDDDTDPIFGPVPLHSRTVMRDEGPDFLFPLKEWSLGDLWDYTERFNVPIQTDRYDVENRREWPDKTFNSDWYPCCLRCVDKRKDGQMVFCPKMKRELKNVSSAAPEYGWTPDYFGTVKKG